MDAEREGNLAVAALKIALRKQLAIRDIANLKREVGNMVKQPEMVEIKANSEELLKLGKCLLAEVFREQMGAI